MALTFTELVLQACTIAGKTDTATQAFGLTEAIYWHNFIWDQYELRETLSFIYTTLAPSATEIVCPPQIERVLQARTDTGNVLEYQEPASFMVLRASIFEEVGTPTNWTELPPMGLRVRPSNEKISFTAGASDVGKQIIVKGESSGEEVRETVTLINGTVNTVNNYDLIFPLSKPSTVGDIAVATVTTVQVGATLRTFERSKRYCRLQVFATPSSTSSTVNVLLLGKRGAPIITDGGDTVSLRTSERSLRDLVISSIWTRERQLGLAGTIKQEALQELEGLAERERNQSASKIRVIPQDTSAYNDFDGFYNKY